MDNNHAYIDLFNGFLSEYKRGMVSGEEVGEVIVRLASFYAQYNSALVEAERNLSKVAKEMENKVDESSGKPISSTKAKTFTDATDEAFVFNKARSHVQNIEQFINSMKSLQKGILNEYAHQ